MSSFRTATELKLKYVCRVIGGGTPDKENLDFWNGDIPWVSPKDMGHFHICRTEDHISPEAVAASATTIVPAGSVLVVVRSGILRHTLPVGITQGEFAINQDIKALVPLRQLRATFMAYFIKGNEQRFLSEWKKTGTTVESIEQELMQNALILVPSGDEQIAVTDFLDENTSQIDGLIAKKQRLIELLDEKRSALISHAVTQGLNPGMPMKDSGVAWLASIPRHWCVKPLKYLAEIQGGLTIGKKHDPNEVLTTRPYLRVANVQDGHLDLNDITLVQLPAREIDLYELHKGDVVVTEGGDFDKLGRGYVWNEEIPGCLHQNHIFAARPNLKVLLSEFLSALMTSAYGRNYFTATSVQATNLACTNRSKLSRFTIPVPSVGEQDAICRRLDESS